MAGGTCIDAGYVPTSNGHGEGAVAVSADGGQTWAMATVPPGLGVLQSTACLSASVCLAAGTTGTTVSDIVPAKGEVLRSADGGHTWAPVTGAMPVDDVYGVACPSATQCVMVGTKWAGSPGRRRGRGGPEHRCRGFLPELGDGVHPHHVDRGGLPVDGRLRGRRGGHGGAAHAPQPKRHPDAAGGSAGSAPGHVEAPASRRRRASEEGSLVRRVVPP